MRDCKHCKQTFPATAEFFPKKNFTMDNGVHYEGLDHRCRTCYNTYQYELQRLRKGMALLPQHIKEAYSKSCWCCGAEGVPLHNDHERGGGFRGILCKVCNNELGRLGDNYKKALESGADQMYLDYLLGSEYRLGKKKG